MLPLSYTYSRNIASLSSGPARYFKGPFKYLNDSQIPTLFYTLAHEITTLFCNSTLKKVPFSGTFHSPPPPAPQKNPCLLVLIQFIFTIQNMQQRASYM